MNACKIRPDENYWHEKLAAFLHDPPDKALSIWGHVKRADLLKDEIYVSAEEGLVRRADQVASGLDRTFLPEKEDQGAVDFKKYPYITHPTGTAEPLHMGPIEKTCPPEEIIALIQQDESKLPKKQPQRAFALFHYFRHVMAYRLWKENVCGLSGRWFHLPADTRLPDHSIWQHCALTSALYSCYRLSSEKKASLMVFSLTPVQDFIARSRKLRDHWTASLILSWLASEGLWAVVSRYGSDHIIYPSPLGQALIESRLDKACGFSKWSCRYHRESQAATLPNKFLFLVPKGEEEEAAQEIEGAIKAAWKDLAERVETLVKSKCFKRVPSVCREAFDEIFRRQTEHFWEFHWAAVPLLDDKAFARVSVFLPRESLVEPLKAYLKKAEECGLPHLTHKEKFFYPAIYDFLGRGLAAEKLSPKEKRKEESGIKCHLHLDLEALRFSCVECKEQGKQCELGLKGFPDPNPRPSRDPCWERIRKKFSKSEFKETERLSAISLIKRLAGQAVKKEKDHPLYPFFKEANRFPSTTEMALRDWLYRAQRDLEELGLFPKEVAEILHRKESGEKNEIEYISEDREENVEEKVEELLNRRKEVGDEPSVVDRYYAVLIMDGDRMGKLLSGGFAARWRDALHPELVRRLEAGEIAEKFWPCFWPNFLEDKRRLSPSVHAAISQALSDFALHTVPRIVDKHRGRLIYAGGDDVCAVFPLSTVVDAARQIAKAYNWAFVRLAEEEGLITEEVSDASSLADNDRLLLHLGPGDEISISAGLLIVHHKWPLRAALQRAHELLDLAKDSGRAALAIELQRRAGERRTFVAGFRDQSLDIPVWDAFEAVLQALAKRDLSSSFIYRLAGLEEGLLPLRDRPPDMIRFVRAQIKGEEKQGKDCSHEIVSVLLGSRPRESLCKSSEDSLPLEALIIANFLAEAKRRNELYG